MLEVPKTHSRFGDKRFSVIDPKLWNNLPNKIKQANSVKEFRILLKTYDC